MFVWKNPNVEDSLPQIMVSMTEWSQKSVELNIDPSDEKGPNKMLESFLEDSGYEHGQVFVFSDVMILTRE